LAEAEQLLARVRELIAQANERRLPSDYPVVTLTVCQNFIPYAREDVEKGEVRRAQEAADEMVGMIQAATADLEKALAEKVTLQPVPRYRTSRIRIVDGHFVAATRVHSTGKRERRPVFFNGYGHFGAVRRDVEKFPRYGVNIIQIEFGPNSVFPEEGVTSEAAIEDFLSVLDRAEKNNVAVNLLLSPHYFPGWALEKWPELGKCGGGFIRFCIDAPEARDIEERFLRVVIPRIRGRRGLHSLCLSNEPIYNRTADCPHTRRLWAEWLEQRHGDIARLNERYGAKYESFADVEVPAADPVREEPRFYDWCVFNQERFAGWHKWMADIIHEIAPDIPVHAKIMPTIFQRRTIGWGVDPELFCEMGQIAGNDCWKMYSGEGEWASGWQTENMFYDLLHSMRGQPVFNSENHLITDRDTAYKPPVHVRNVLWQGAIHGQGATTIWVWERTFDPRSDFSGSIMHRPGCAEAVGKTNLDLMRLSREVALLQSAPAEVAILYSIPSIVYGAEYLSEMSGAYQALNFTGNKIDFISEGQIERGKARQYRLIVIPAAVSVKDETYRGLVRFVRRGGRVAVIGEESLAMNEYKQERDADGLLRSRRCVVIPEGLAARELRDRLLAVLREAHVSGPVKVVEAGSEEPPWGVEWLAAEDGGRTVVNLVNYTNEVKRLRISLPQGGKPVNLFTGRPLPRTVRLEPLEPLLIASR
ncbi:MAG: beta-galactosidase, partial [Armatimonadota bacterium]